MKLKNFIKTTHFRERQKTRLVSDRLLKEILSNGLYEETPTGVQITYQEYLVHLDNAGEILITIIQKVEKSTHSKVLSRKQANDIKSKILEKLSQHQKEEDPFLEFVKKNKIQKI